MTPLVSINLCCYNSEKYLRETLQSIADQTYKNWELVIVNDGSRDSTESIIFEFRDRGHRVVYHYQENRGISASRNKAIELSRGDYIAFIDHDDVWRPGLLTRQLAAFDEDTILVYGNYLMRDMTTGREYMPFDPDREFHSGRLTARLVRKNLILIETAVVRTEAVRRLGQPFDPKLLMADDIDFLLRLSLTGNFRYTREICMIYRMHPENVTNTKRHYYVHDLSYMLQKYSNRLDRRMLRDLARQYILTVKIDLNYAGFRIFPFLSLGLNIKHVIISLLLPFSRDRNILEVKASLMRPFRYVRSFFSRREKL
ncbi:MAG: glycosyltransferase [Nitrospirae bacterium]|nr:glycosyltransferase [Nitrospirota bacterium]